MRRATERREIVVPKLWTDRGCAFEFRAGFTASPDATNPVQVHDDTREIDQDRVDAWEAGWRAAARGRATTRKRRRAA